MGRRYFSVLGITVALAVVLVACGAPDDDKADPTVTRIPDAANAPVLAPDDEGSPVAGQDHGSPVAVDGTPVAVDGTPAAGTPAAVSPEDQAAAYEVVSLDIRFEPETLAVPADTAVAVSLPNEGAAAHNFSIDELDISIDQAPGEVTETEINAPAGEYEYYCNVPGHREAGMVGTLTVE